jgi:hypothetical protein
MVGAVKALTPDEVKTIQESWKKQPGNPNFRKR